MLKTCTCTTQNTQCKATHPLKENTENTANVKKKY